MAQQDYRARLQPKDINQAEFILGPRSAENILFPLYSTRGVLFPYTPSVTTGSAADYDQTSFIHSNYPYNAYVKSYPKPITITAEFTAQTNDEALYLLAVLHFFRSVTKSYFGVTPYNRAGTPPPVLLFNYLGEFQFNNVPILVKSVDYTLEANIDYVPVNTQLKQNYSNNIGVSLPCTSSGGFTYVPTHLTMTVETETQYIPVDLRDNFNLDQFRSGKLIGRGYI